MILKTPGFSCVYWIRKAEHTDETTQGYIGVSSNPNKRWIQHKTDSKCGRHTNKHLSNAILKHGDQLIYEVIFGGTDEQCFAYELELRSKPSIGWNLMSGGPTGKITEEGRRKLSEKAKARTPYQRETQLWKSYCTKHGKCTRAEYLDIKAAKNKQIPPSKANLPIFSLTENEEYRNIETASSASGIHILEILDSCTTKTGDWIFLKDL